jgi:UDP-glucose 4-epimerase
MKSFFISGGAGFIGSHIARKILTNPNSSVIIYDNFSSGTRKHIEDLINLASVKIVEADIKDIETLKSAMAGCDVVFHTAANPDIAKAAIHPDIDFWEGTYLTNNILEAMRVNNVKHIFYTSGSGIYGEDPEIYFREDHGPCNPISTYGASKLACEALICSYTHMFGLIGRVFRFANVVGPKQTHGVGYDFIRKLKQHPDYLDILGDGTQLKSYIHVNDVIQAMFTVMDKISNKSERYDVYNVSTLDYITVNDIADVAIKVAELDQKKVEKRFTGGSRGWKGDVPVIKFNSEKIRGLGWGNKFTSLQAIENSISSMREEIKC